MSKPLLAWTLVGLLACTSAHPFDLVTLEDMLASNRAKESFWPKSSPVADAPNIELLRPSLHGALTSPTAIELRFQAAQGSQIRPETFRVLYGRLRLDITPRLLRATTVSATGLSVREAQLPAGKHRLLLSIEDNQGRTGQTVLDFEIQ